MTLSFNKGALILIMNKIRTDTKVILGAGTYRNLLLK